MIKNLVQLYAMIMCCCSAILLIVASCVTLNAILDFTAFVQYKHATTFIKYSSNEQYIDSLDKEESTSFSSLDEEAKTNIRNNKQERALSKIYANSSESLIDFGLLFFIGMITFIVHWRLYKRYSEGNSISF
jgi:hypothetical protein